MPKDFGRREKAPASRSTPAARSSTVARKPLWLRIARSFLIWGAGLALLATIVLATAVYMTQRELPSFTSLQTSQNGQMIVVRARDGTELVSLGPSYGRWMPYQQIPTIMKDAIVSVEDRRYRQHPGIDAVGVVRSLVVRAESGRWRQGGSTITQQLARTIFLNNSRTFGRKIREAVLALALERKFTKDELLELYLNKVYFGGGAYGIDAASRKFFGHSANELSIAEAAIIAGLVKAPSNYSPTADVKAAIARGKVVLITMTETGVVTSSEAANADLDSVKIAKEKGQNSVRYFTDWALPQLDVLLPETNEPIEVWTTLDPGMQNSATAAISTYVPKGAQGALVSLDSDGAVRAMVGGTDYVNSNYNRATQAIRQPGSAWKLFVYLAALEAGYTPDDRVVDEPVTIDGWSPHNSGRNFAGEINVRTAFSYSKNTVAASLGNEVGFGTVASMARRFGITTDIATNPSMVLGTSEVRVIDMTRAFAAVSAKGTAVIPYGIVKVTTTKGDLLYQHKVEAGQVLVPPHVSAGITDLLQSAVATGTGRAGQIGRPVAGKTGTTSSNKDGWFLGFSSGITTGVWMGRDDAKPVPGLQGGQAPASAFAAFMRYAVKDRPIQPFDTELKLPEWQLEPDDEQMAGNPDAYYYTDENGNLVQPNGARRTAPGDGPARYDNGAMDPEGGSGNQGPAAAGEDFLEQATGRQDRGDPELRAAPPPPGGYRSTVRQSPVDRILAPQPRPSATPPGQYPN